MQFAKFKEQLSHFSKGMSIGQIPQLLYVCMIIVAFVGAAYIMAESFQGTVNNSSKAYTGIGYVISFMDNIVKNLPTVGIIIFIVLLVGAVMWIRQSKAGAQGGA
jgi:flagellar basal body-associated protein FliL